MGRTVPTYRMILDSEIADWTAFRRALCRQDRAAFDDMMMDARRHASACSNAARLNPTESLLMSIILEHEKELSELRKRLKM